MIFLIPTDNTSSEQRVSVYRHQVSQNQSKWTVEAQWKFMCWLQKQRGGAPRLALAWLKVQRVQGDSGRSGRPQGQWPCPEQAAAPRAVARRARRRAHVHRHKEARALEVAKLVQAVHHARLTLCTTPRKQLRCTVWPRRARVAERRQAQGGHDGVAVGGCQDLPVARRAVQGRQVHQTAGVKVRIRQVKAV